MSPTSRILLALCCVCLSPVAASRLHAQNAPPLDRRPTPRQAFCFPARALATCDWSGTWQLGYFRRLGGTAVAVPGRGHQGEVTPVLQDHAVLELGLLRNVGPRRAVGAVAFAGVNTSGRAGPRAGAMARLGLWQQANAIDLSLGYVSASPVNRVGVERVGGPMADVAFNLHDKLIVNLRADRVSVPSQGAATTMYGGVQLGSTLGGVASLVVGAVALVLGSALAK